jgi:hypothetical protein
MIMREDTSKRSNETLYYNIIFLGHLNVKNANANFIANIC